MKESSPPASKKSRSAMQVEPAKKLKAAEAASSAMKTSARKSKTESKAAMQGVPAKAAKAAPKAGAKANAASNQKDCVLKNGSTITYHDRMQKPPSGCATCRNRPGCTPSCWLRRCE